MNTNYNKFIKLKQEAGLHSPSPFELKNDLQLDIKVDACFLCNPYALDLYIRSTEKIDLLDYIKYYPPQNKILANLLSKSLDVNSNHIIVGNGAIQLIELILKEHMGKKKCVVSPTFSTYYEFDADNILFFKTVKENNFHLDKEALVAFCKLHKIEVLVLVNPNNPTGTALTKDEISFIIQSLQDTTIIVDESFIDFFDRKHSVEGDVINNSNLIVIRSLSKDFGIAGLRLGYAICRPDLIDTIKNKYGLCWNINGLACLFLELFADSNFQSQYQLAREKYLQNRDAFYSNLLTLKNMRVYESYANFFIVDCFQNINEVFTYLLFEKGVYTRILNDKLDLDNTFLRIACGSEEDNQVVFNALKEIDNKL